MPDREAKRRRVCAALDLAHSALRAVDASDSSIPQTDKTLDRISQAIDAVERIACELGYRLSEFRGSMAPTTQTERQCACQVRSPQDYATAFGEYLANAADAFMDVVDERHGVHSDDDVSDTWRALKSAIYNFRKRAERAKL